MPLLAQSGHRLVHCTCLLSTQSGHWPMMALSDRQVTRLKSPTAVPIAPAVAPAVTTPTPTTTVHAPPAVTPAASPPLHVRQIVEVGGGSRRKREDRCGLGRSGPARKIRPAIPIANTVRNIMCPPFFYEISIEPLERLINSKTRSPFHEWSFSEEQHGTRTRSE